MSALVGDPVVYRLRVSVDIMLCTMQVPSTSTHLESHLAALCHPVTKLAVQLRRPTGEVDDFDRGTVPHDRKALVHDGS